MVENLNCPVCGTNNPEYYFVEAGWGEVSRSYNCNNCGYFYHKSSRSNYSGIPEFYPRKYDAKVKETNIKVRSREYCLDGIKRG